MVNLVFRFMSSINKYFNKLYSYMISKRLNKTRCDMYIEYPIYLSGADNITIGSNFSTHKRLRIETYSCFGGEVFFPKIIIGDNVCVNYDCHIGAINNITIGDNVLIASKVFITDHFHGSTKCREDLLMPPASRKLHSKGSVIIDNNVWIGENVSILPNVHIGEGAVIGANSVVTKDVPPFSVVCGVPARIVKQL